MSAEADQELAIHRQRIDAIDVEILALMNQRIDAASHIGSLKKKLDAPAYYRPEREAQILRRLVALNKGAMSNQAIESLFREVMSITRGTEADFTIAVLGPEGAFSELAARQQFGSVVTLQYLGSIEEVIRATETGRSNFAVVQVENSAEGSVNTTLDQLIHTPLTICGEIYLKVERQLMATCQSLEALENIGQVTAQAQCGLRLKEHLSDVVRTPAGSNAEGALRVTEDCSIAAVASRLAISTDNLPILVSDIEDQPVNTTRFLVLSDQPVPVSGEDKTSILISLIAAKNRPDALFYLLQPLVKAGLDLIRIESMHSHSELEGHVFFIDFQGHSQTEVVARALAEVENQSGLFKLLGSYPVAISASG